MDADVIIIGSGAAATEAAFPLIAAGRTVLMLDVGKTAPAILEEPLEGTWSDIRKTREDQWRWFLGEDLSAIPLGGVDSGYGGGMTSGNRSYVVEESTTLTPVSVQGGSLVGSLAQGGLGAAWGAASAELDTNALEAMGLNAEEIRHSYATVTKRIGIAGGDDPNAQPPLAPDHHAEACLQSFQKNKAWFENHKLTAMQPPTAMLTQDLGERTATQYQDLDYWSNAGRSVYRPQYAIEALQKEPGFTYQPGHLVEDIQESETGVSVHARHLQQNSTRSYTAQKVIVAAGAIQTAHLLLKSRNLPNTAVPFIGKDHGFVACLRPSALGQAGPDRRHSLCQLLLRDTERLAGHEAGCAQLYSYRSLMLFRLLSGVPLPTPLALNALRMLTPALVIADIRYATVPNGTLTLSQSEQTSIQFTDPQPNLQAKKRTQSRLKKGLRRLGLLPVRTINFAPGTSSHYGGTVPIAGRGPLAANPDGRLQDSQHIYVADSSLFCTLPALPHTLTIMATANYVGTAVAKTYYK